MCSSLLISQTRSVRPSGASVLAKVGVDLHAACLDLPALIKTPITRSACRSRFNDRGTCGADSIETLVLKAAPTIEVKGGGL